jgi:hypothetical protein
MSFAYNASAVALGGRIVLPTPTTISSQASAALVPTGGEGRETVRNFNYNGIITFDEASVYVTGSENNGVFNTLSTVSIRNLNVLNVLHADFLVASITSRHEKGADEGEITFQGTSVDNLQIAGRRVDPRLNHGFYARYPTHKTITEAMKTKVADSDCPEVAAWLEEEVTNERIRCGSTFNEDSCRTQLRNRNVAGLLANRFCWNRDSVGNAAPDDHGHIHGSLADDIPGIDEMSAEEEGRYEPEQLRQRHPIRRQGYVVRVAGFGTIKLAEIVIKPGERRLNLFRLELGSPTTGDLTVGSAGTNGTELIP